MPVSKPRLILGSSSPRRRDLLAQIGVVPDVIKGADVDETPRKGELPDAYCLRVALEKNAALAHEFANDFLLTADTTVAVGRRIFGKAENAAEQESFLRVFSGRSHRVHTAIVLRAPDGRLVHRLQTSRVKVKRLSEDEIKAYASSDEWQDKAGYKFNGVFGKYIISVHGAPAGIIGLPLYETAQMLKGVGYDPAA